MKSSSPSRLQHVLLIDDNEIDNFINERIITSSGFSEVCTVKTSADEAIEYLNIISKDSKVPLPQVIFLDLNLIYR